MQVVNMGAPFYLSKNPKKCLENTEKEKNRNYLEACLKQRQNFTPFVASVDSLLRIEAAVTLKCIVSRLPKKWKEPFSRTCRYMKSRVAITIVRATHHCIRGAKVPASQFSVKPPQ